MHSNFKILKWYEWQTLNHPDSKNNFLTCWNKNFFEILQDFIYEGHCVIKLSNFASMSRHNSLLSCERRKILFHFIMTEFMQQQSLISHLIFFPKIPLRYSLWRLTTTIMACGKRLKSLMSRQRLWIKVFSSRCDITACVLNYAINHGNFEKGKRKFYQHGKSFLNFWIKRWFWPFSHVSEVDVGCFWYAVKLWVSYFDVLSDFAYFFGFVWMLCDQQGIPYRNFLTKSFLNLEMNFSFFCQNQPCSRYKSDWLQSTQMWHSKKISFQKSTSI